MSDKEKEEISWIYRLCICTLLSLAVFLLLGIAMQFFVIPMVVEKSIILNSQLVEGSRLMEKWKTPEYKMDFNVYVHSIKNPDEFMSGELPDLSTTGPYSFTKKMEHKVIASGDGRVKYKSYNSYFFNESQSCITCILGNRVWIPNMIYQKFIEAASTTSMRAASTTLLSQTAFLEVEVGELLFEGYRDPFLDKICEIPFMNFVCDSILDLPDRIGLFFEKNNTYDGEYEILDGTRNPEELGKIVSWDGEKNLDETWWNSDEARTIRGTDGSLFPPFLEKSDRLYVYVSQFCRSIWLDFDSERVVLGIPVYRYIMPSEVFDYSLSGNKGYCNPTDKRFFKSQKDDCWPKGLLDISHCQRSQPPIVLSLPNFLFADEEVKKSVKGLLTPNLDRDSIYVDIEPRTGVVVQAKRRVQVNVEMWKGKDLTFPVSLKKMKSTVMPVITVDEDVMIDSVSLGLLRSELFNTEWWAYALAKISMLIGMIAMIATVFVLSYKSSSFSRFFCCNRSGKHIVSPVPDYVPRNVAPKV